MDKFTSDYRMNTIDSTRFTKIGVDLSILFAIFFMMLKTVCGLSVSLRISENSEPERNSNMRKTT